MKRLLLISIITIGAMLSVKAQSPYTYTMDGKTAILNGIVTKYILQNDSAFRWYAGSESSYTPDTAAQRAMELNKGKVSYIVFGGTWCEDTQFILPKFFKLQSQSGTPDTHVSFFAMDRNKKTIGNIGDAFKITNVPTIIVMRDGKEIGRVVEYGSSGKWDKDLAQILK